MMTAALAGLLYGSASLALDSPLAKAIGLTVHRQLTCTTLPNGVRGVVTNEDLPMDTLLMSVPLSSCVAVPRGVDDDKQLAEALLDATRTIPAWIEYRDNFMPSAKTNAAMLWTEDEIAELQLPAACELASELRERYEESKPSSEEEEEGATRLDEWAWAWSMVYSRSFMVEVPGDADDEDEDEPTSALRLLAPFLDLFNHVSESPSEYAARYAEREEAAVDDDEYDDDGQLPSPWRLLLPPPATSDGEEEGGVRVGMYADRATSQGEEVVLPYGLESDAELLVTSGFLLSSSSTNKEESRRSSRRSMSCNTAEFIPLFTDVVEMAGLAQLKLHLSEGTAQERLNVLASLDAVDAPLAARPGPGLEASGHVLGCAALLCMPPSQDEEEDEKEADGGGFGFEEAYVEAVGHHTLVPIASALEEKQKTTAAVEAEAARFCAEAAENLLKDLPTTLEEDEEVKQKQQEEGHEEGQGQGGGDAFAAALEYRIRAKRLLRDFVAACHERAARGC